MGAEEDASELAKQALQLVWRIGVRATVAYVVDVFRGSKNAAICRAGHDRVQGAGAGSHLA
jgi:superfamily II DNA helicase RecQ